MLVEEEAEGLVSTMISRLIIDLVIDPNGVLDEILDNRAGRGAALGG